MKLFNDPRVAATRALEVDFQMIFGPSDMEREALAAEGARVLPKMVGWTMEPCNSILPPPMSAYGYDEKIKLIVGFWYPGLSYRKMIDAVRAARADMLMVELGRRSGHRRAFQFTLLLYREGEVITHSGLRLWAEHFCAPLWLVSDHQDIDALPFGFSLHSDGIKAKTIMPFADPVSAQMGLRIADLHMIAEIGGHFV